MARHQDKWSGSAPRWLFVVGASLALGAHARSVSAQPVAGSPADVLPPPAYPQGPPLPPAGYGPPPYTYPTPSPPTEYPGYPYGYGYGYPPRPYYAPPGAYQYPAYVPPTPRRSTGAMVAGIILATTGGIAFIGGSLLVSDGQDKTPIYCQTSMGTTLCGREDDSARLGGGVALMILGGLGVGVGIPLAIWGGSRAKPELRVSAGHTSLSWRY